MENLPPKKRIKRLAKHTFLLARRFYYKGNKVTCPICQHSFKKMLPGGFQSDVVKELEIVGAGFRPNNICPYCLSTDRDRLVFLYLKYQANVLGKNLKILHVSPEPALYSAFSKLPNLDYTIGTKYAEGAYYPSEITFFDLLGMPHRDNTFDIVICNHVLEHIQDDHQAMSEIFRIIKPDGFAILQVPISLIIKETIEDERVVSETDRHRVFGQFDHVRVYGSDYKNRLESVGFHVTTHNPIIENWTDVSISKFALNEKEHLYIAHKPN